ncbi:MAG: polysaccharide biosynthesis/export family protein [Syntrophobacteraceae bacterium]|nr:polysaccharide biosynthesis/export family protein [Syntrophobacteraceae bacterium]
MTRAGYFSTGLIPLILTSCLFLYGCASVGPGGEDAHLAAVPSNSADYLIAPGDVLEIAIYGEDGLDKRKLVVRPDGKVSFPLVGDVRAGGLTTEQVKAEVEGKARKFIPEAVATVSVRQLDSMQYYVLGKVAKPGMFNVSRPITVLQALALAGGNTTFADEKHIEIVRSDGGRITKMEFNYNQVKNGKDLAQNILLQRGDTVVVP